MDPEPLPNKFMNLLATSVALSATALAPLAAADLVINEVLYDPVGPDLGAERIELRNDGAGPVSLDEVSLCINFPPSGPGMPNRVYWFPPAGVSLGAGESVIVHWLATGVDSSTNLFTGTANADFACTAPSELDNSLGSVALYEGVGSCQNFGSSNFIRDFVQWGGTTHREPVAVAAGIWSAAQALPIFGEGSSIAYDGDGDALADFFEDASPSLGQDNTAPGLGATTSFGAGCLGSNGVPAIAGAGGPPAQGNQSFSIDLENGLSGSVAIYVFGFASASIPAFGCELWVSPFACLQLLPATPVDAGGHATLPIAVPDAPGLAGASVFFQAGVIDPSAPGGDVALSNGLELVL